MIADVTLYTLGPGLPADQVDQMMREARSILLRVSGILTVRGGKRIEDDNPHHFLLYLEFESLDKRDICRDHPLFIKFLETVIKPHTIGQQAFHYELDPGKNIKYS